MNFKEETQKKVEHIEEILQKYLPKEEGKQKTVISAMNYSIAAGGKRIRPLLMQESFRLYHGTGEAVEAFMSAIEMIHTYSLIHDDLPAMDNDEYRRGKKTTHVVYGEAMAILAGDALLNYAFETALKACGHAKEQNILRALAILSDKSGIYGMVGGQTVDVESEKKQLALDGNDVLYIHENKTAALLEASLMVGACLADAGDDEIEKMRQIGSYIGIAFQIKDDILDVTSTLEELGKPVGSDAKNEKMTYVTWKGLSKAEEDVKNMSEKAIALLDSIPGDKEYLRELILELISRKK